MIYPEPRLSFHPEANLFFLPDGSMVPDAHKIFADILVLASSGNFSTANENIRLAFAQAGFVNLWFFLKVIAGHSGPYQKLTASLHMDMANFYQDSMYPGAKAAGFIGRSHFKSSVWTHGANTWEITRNPELEIALGSSIYDRSLEFLHQSQDTIENNEFYAWLYPEFVPENPRMLKGWNDEALTLPNKRRNARTPNIMPITVGGSTAGIHADKLKLDDIVGDAQLNSLRQATADMVRIGNWFRSSVRTLVKDWKYSQIFVAGTRYSPDDPYEWPMSDCKKQVGYWADLPEEYTEKPDGEWDVYYRTIKEHGEIIFPEAFDEINLQKLMENDFWTYQTQYANNPYSAEVTEMSGYVPKHAFMDYDALRGFVISTEYGEEILLSDCDVVAGIDPAATEKGISAKTSRSVIFVLATDPKHRKFLIELRLGFVDIPTLFGWMFEIEAKYRFYLRLMFLEAQGPFKVLVPFLRREELARKISLPVRPVPAQGDKVARIRAAWLPVLKRGDFYAIGEAYSAVFAELKTFPNGRRLDVLDAGEIALRTSADPEPGDPDDDWDEDDEQYVGSGAGRNQVTGY